jgi:hypothetical protein
MSGFHLIASRIATAKNSRWETTPGDVGNTLDFDRFRSDMKRRAVPIAAKLRLQQIERFRAAH